MPDASPQLAREEASRIEVAQVFPKKKMYKLCFFVPKTHVESVKAALFQAGAGHIGAYDCCCWQTEGTGQFRPRPGSHPAIGKTNQLTHVPEWKVEMVCADDVLKQAIEALRQAHPYETPAFEYWRIQDEMA